MEKVWEYLRKTQQQNHLKKQMEQSSFERKGYDWKKKSSVCINNMNAHSCIVKWECKKCFKEEASRTVSSSSSQETCTFPLIPAAHTTSIGKDLAWSKYSNSRP